MDNIIIRYMQPADISQVMTIEYTAFSLPWTPSAYATEINNAATCYFVAVADGNVVGYTGAWFIMDEAHITTLAVSNRYQHMGIGGKLLAKLLSKSINEGIRYATLEVRMSNAIAQKLYKKYGFVSVAVRKGYYFDNNEDALIMWTPDMSDIEYRDFINDMCNEDKN